MALSGSLSLNVFPGSSTRLPGKLLVVSGREGRTIQEVIVPDGRESYYSPVIYRQDDLSEVVLFGTGGETHPGALWVVGLKDLLGGNIDQVRQIDVDIKMANIEQALHAVHYSRCASTGA